MTTTVFIQGRIGSTRLPGKMLLTIAGKTILEVLVERLRKVPTIDRIVLASSVSPENDPLALEATRLGIDCFRGREENILDRLYQASHVFPSDIVIRVTGDCPLIDPLIVSEAIEKRAAGDFDMVSNTRIRSYPDGMDVEVFRREALIKAWESEVRGSGLDMERFVSPTKYIHHQAGFSEFDLVLQPSAAEVRLTLDYAEDFEVIKQTYLGCGQHNPDFTMSEMIAFLQTPPEVMTLNKQYVCLDYGLAPPA